MVPSIAQTSSPRHTSVDHGRLSDEADMRAPALMPRHVRGCQSGSGARPRAEGTIGNTGDPWNLGVEHAEGISSTGVLKLDGVTITNHGYGANTTATGNGTGDGCGMTRSCANLMTCRQPKLDSTSSCATSYVNGSGLPGSDWNVCAAD